MQHKDTDSDELLDDDLLIESYQSEVRHPSGNPSSSDAGDPTDSSEYPEDSEAEDIGDSPESAESYEPTESDDSSDADDFYNDDDYEEEVKPAPKPKQPKLDPEDPDYWLDEQSEFEHIIPKPKKAWIWWTAAIVALLALIIGTWIWFFRPYVDDAVKYGYIKNMERRGTFIKTFEGVLIPYRELGDGTPTYFEEIPFSVDGDSLATQMKMMMLDNIPVRLDYELYHQPLLWKGGSPMVIVGVDTADVNKILPPEYQ